MFAFDLLCTGLVGAGAELSLVLFKGLEVALLRAAREQEDTEGGREKTTGQLNPTWVEWLMGYPTGWTDLNVSEIVSSHKSPTTSEE